MLGASTIQSAEDSTPDKACGETMTVSNRSAVPTATGNAARTDPDASEVSMTDAVAVVPPASGTVAFAGRRRKLLHERNHHSLAPRPLWVKPPAGAGDLAT